MDDIRNDCSNLLVHIKKSKSATLFYGYTNMGIVGYFIKLPFGLARRKHFAKVEMYTERIDRYIKENNIELEIKSFEELNNSSIIYNASQMSSLGYKQFEHRMKYLEKLEEQIKKLIKIYNIN